MPKMYPDGAVKRMAWPISRSLVKTSSYRSSSGAMGSPAASAEVQYSGRVAVLLRLKTAPLVAVHPLASE